MKVKQIATILNTVINPEQIGETAVVNEDLSNIVDVGKALTAAGTFGENFDNFTKALIDQVGKVIFVDRVYTAQGPNLLRDAWEYGSVLQKVRCDLPDADDNKTWSLADLANGSTVDPFVITKPTVKAKYFNSKTTFEVPITLAEEQVKEAFKSPTDMNRFMSMIENRVLMKRALCTEAMSKRTLNNLIAQKIHAKSNVVNLLKDYNTAYTKTLTAATCLSDPDFLKYCAKTIMMYKKYIAEASMLYNNDGYVTFTPEDRLEFTVLSEFSKDLQVYMYADTYNKEFVQLDGYSEVAYWQGSGTNNAFNEISKIDVKALTADGTEFTVSQTGVVAVMYDRDAAAICNENARVTSIYNPKAEYWNYFYKYDCAYMNDTAENCIVFIISDAEA